MTSAIWTTRVPQELREGPYNWHKYHHTPRYWGSHAARAKREKRREQCQAKRIARAAELLENPKQHYFTSISLQFPGLKDHFENPNTMERPTESTHVALYQVDIQKTWPTESFSFDVWCALLPASNGCVFGGVLFSAESSTGPNLNEASTEDTNFIYVGVHGSLYCSMTSGDKRALTTLQPSRWYHLAVTFDRIHMDSSTQCIYIDGVCIDTQTGVTLVDNWNQFKNFKLGDGLMTEQSMGIVRDDETNSWSRWLLGAFDYGVALSLTPSRQYGFNGLMDEFRIWEGVLTPDDVQQLVVGREVAAVCDWSLMRDTESYCFQGDLWAMRSTRPTEGMCLRVQKAFQVSEQ